jgi:hypothetical protein
MLLGHLPGQSGRSGGGQPGHRRQRLPGDIAAVAVQPDQEVLAGQLCCRYTDQQLAGPEPPVALLDRTRRRVQPPDHVEPIQQFGDRHHAGVAGHTRIRVADPDPPARALPPILVDANLVHQMGALPGHQTTCFLHTNHPRPQRYPSQLPACVNRLLAESGLMALCQCVGPGPGIVDSHLASIHRWIVWREPLIV